MREFGVFMERLADKAGNAFERFLNGTLGDSEISLIEEHLSIQMDQFRREGLSTLFPIDIVRIEVGYNARVGGVHGAFVVRLFNIPQEHAEQTIQYLMAYELSALTTFKARSNTPGTVDIEGIRPHNPKT